ncbi:MAG: TetR/AcrR family transcriptional regulator [Ferruginibacter sp.]
MEELKNKILASAHNRFLSHGIRWLNLDYIASDCGISRKTFNLYFNRNQLIENLIKNKIEGYTRSLSVIQKEKPRPIDELRKIFSFMEKLAADFSDIFIRDLKIHFPKDWLLIDDFIKGSLMKIFMGNLARGVKQGVYRKTTDVVLLTEIYFSTGLMLMEKNFRQLDPSLKVKIFREVNDNFFAGLTNLVVENSG